MAALVDAEKAGFDGALVGETRFDPFVLLAAAARVVCRPVRAIWRAWSTGEPLNFVGQFYTHNLMTPVFAPGPNPYGQPKIYLAAVGPAMTELAGEVADGVVCSPATTERYLREVTVPALERWPAAGWEVAGGIRDRLPDRGGDRVR